MRLRDDEGEDFNCPKGQYLGSLLLTGSERAVRCNAAGIVQGARVMDSAR